MIIECYFLRIIGLSEKRPSLMLGDSVIAVKSDEYGAIPHEGVIHTVRSQSVLVAFEQRFQDTYCGEQCDVEFKFNRSQFKRYHHAVEVGIKCMQEEVLFPKSLRHKKPQVDFLTRAQAKAIRRRNRSLEAKQDKVIVLKPSTQSQNNKKKTTTQPDVNSSSGKKNKRRSVAERLFGDQLNDANDNGAPKPDPDLSGYVLPVFPGHVFSVDHPDIPKPSKDWPNYFSMTPGEDTEAKDPIPPYVPRRNKGKKSQIGDRAILSWVNPNLNSEQQSAVCRILSGESRPLPYVIYGPPGTGKTMTLVECILQIFLLRPNSRIMIATPSNSSADLITERLFLSGKVELGDMVRLNAFQRGLDSIPSAVQPFCQANTDVEALGNIVRHRIIVSTCGTAGALYKLGLKNGHFTHCFLDEAGHMTEPETLIPIGLVALNEAQIVLAGDPKQLGPVLQSNFAKLYGLEVSLLERLCARPLYERDVEKFKDHGGYDPLLVTKLVKNYRSHDSIIAIPSLLFYDDELEPMAEETKKGLFLGKTMLPNPQVPIIFHGVKGKDRKRRQ